MSAAALRQQPPSADGANTVASQRFFDSASGCWMVKVSPGEFYVTSRPDETIVTVLGSCVAACIRDPKKGIGGMNHFMLPQGFSSGWGGQNQSTRFGNFAMEKLVNELIKAGCSRESLEIKVFGGGNVTDSRNAIGTDNANFVLRYLEAEGLSCVAQDLGGQLPRRIQYSATTGKVVRRLLGGAESSTVAREETEYSSRLSSKPAGGSVELFD